MKFLSWNVNGLRAIHRKGNFSSIFETDPDFICMQETKAHPEQLPDEVRTPAGYVSHFDHSKGRKGYSGVAIYVKSKYEKQIKKVEYGFGIPKLDQEGRFLAVHIEDPKKQNSFVIITSYFPNGGGGPARLKYKLEFYDAFLKHIEKLKKQGENIIFCGDVNTAHTAIDLARPKENEENTGFLPIERAWIDKVINKGYIDTFRYLHKDKIGAYSYWDMKTFARERNVGWRIDYFFVSDSLKDKIKKSEMLDYVYGSDHCPILLELK